jgi:hypothetical protein
VSKALPKLGPARGRTSYQRPNNGHFSQNATQIFVQEIIATKLGNISFIRFTWSGCDHWEHTRRHLGRWQCSPVMEQFVKHAVSRSLDGKFSAVEGRNVQE